MPSVLPLGDPAPSDGLLPAQAADGAADRAFGLYVHIPFCAVRCGYCDFNTYTATELGGGASQDAYAATAIAEVGFAATVLQASRPAGPPAEHGLFRRRHAHAAPGRGPGPHPGRRRRGSGAWSPAPRSPPRRTRIPSPRNPSQLLADAGFTRVSFGMQSAVPHVLKVLDRTHTPSRVPQVVQWARDAGLAVSLDLIYGTPGESLEDWRYSLETALSYEPDHISAYALIVEDGTKLAAQIRRGEVPGIDDDDHADKYELADELIARSRARLVRGQQLVAHAGAGLPAQPRLLARGRLVGHRPRRALARRRRPLVERQAPHRLRGPARRRGSRRPPGGKRSTPKPANVERVMLEARLVCGTRQSAALGDVGPPRRGRADRRRPGGSAPAAFKGRLVLTLKGRLLADAVVRRILPD